MITKRFLTCSAFCVLGTLNGALMGSLTPLAVGLFSNIAATDLTALWDRLAKRLAGQDALLQNEDLAKATGLAIAAVIAKTAQDPGFSEVQKPLRKLAQRANRDWRFTLQAPDFKDDVAFDPVREFNLTQFFSHRPEDFGQVRALTPETWSHLLRAWQNGAPELTLGTAVTEQVAQRLYLEFPRALREVLKEDFAQKGKAFAGLTLNLLGELKAAIAHQQSMSGAEGLTVWLDAIQAWEGRQTEKFGELATQIESGFGDVTGLLQSLQADLDERLTHLQADVSAIKATMVAAQAQPGLLLAGQPYLRLEDWQGRKTELDWLYGKIAQGKPLLGIDGIGGLGKSTLASKVYGEPMPEAVTARNGEVRRRFWADVSSGAVFAEWARQLLQEFGAAVPTEETQLVAAVVRCLQAEPSLVVVDNLESVLTPALAWQGALYPEFFQTWLECGHRSTVVITTRERPPLRGIEWMPPLLGFAPEEGAALLAAKGIDGDLAAFSVQVEGHPLLLRLVADLLREEYPEAPHLDRLSDLGLGDLGQLLADPQVVGVHRRENVGLVLVLDASYGRLSPLQQEILRAVAILRGTFSEQAVQFCVQGQGDAGEIHQALKGLVKRSLLQRDAANYRLQAVVQAYGRLQVAQLGEQQARHTRAIEYYRSISLPEFDWKEIEDAQYQLERAHHFFELKDYATASACIEDCDDLLTRRGAYSLLAEWNQRLVDSWKPMQSEQYAFSLVLNSLGSAYLSLSQIQNAIAYYEQALAIKREIGDRNGVASALGNLGNTSHSQGNYGNAIAYYEQALEIQREIGDRKGVASVLNNLGNTSYSQGDYGNAIAYYEQALAIKREIGDRNGIAISLNNLGITSDAQGDYRNAIAYYEQALAIKREIGDRNGEANSLGNLGNTSHSQGDYGNAIAYYEQALVIQREIGDRKGVASALNNLGNTSHSQGDYGNAIAYYEQALAIKREIGDRNGVASALGNLGNTSHSQGNYGNAIAYYEQALEIQREIGDRHGEAISWFNLGNARTKVNQKAEAIVAYQTARELYAAMGLETDIQDCDHAIQQISADPAPSHWKTPNFLVRLWRSFKRLVRSLFG